MLWRFLSAPCYLTRRCALGLFPPSPINFRVLPVGTQYISSAACPGCSQRCGPSDDWLGGLPPNRISKGGGAARVRAVHILLLCSVLVVKC